MIMLDLDHFKAYNDRYGHVTGGNCLRQVGAVLAECVGRSVDLAARYGGEEFACILPDTDLAGSVRVAERIKQRIERFEDRTQGFPRLSLHDRKLRSDHGGVLPGSLP